MINKNVYGPFLYLTSIIIFSFSNIACGIIGGTPTENYPFFVLILIGERTCGGTLFATDAVVTAANCLYNRSQQKWASNKDVYVFHTDFSISTNKWNRNWYSCENYFPHELYQPHKHGGFGPFDVAVIKLRGRANIGRSLQKAVLRPCKMHNYKYGFAIGLGLTNQNPNTHSERLMEAALFGDESCGKHSRHWGLRRPDLQVCYSVPGQASTCEGDTGGPLVYKAKGVVDCLIGVSSHNEEKCDDPDYPSVFTPITLFKSWMWKQRQRSN